MIHESYDPANIALIAALNGGGGGGSAQLDALIANTLETLESNASSMVGAYTDGWGYSEYFFKSRTNLKTVIFPELLEISIYGFYQAPIKEGYFDKVTTIQQYSFKGCSQLEKINAPKVTSIKSEAFSGCSKLTSFFAPKIETIGNSAFKSCSKLETIELSDVTSVGGSAFYGSKLKSANLPKVTSLTDSSLFQSCSALESANLANVETKLPNNTFSGCSSLVSVNIPKVTGMGSQCFYNNSSLEEIDAPEATSLGYGTFGGCSKLASVNLPKVSTLTGGSNAGTGAFSNCISLTSINLPMASSIDRYTFSGCSGLTTLILGASSVCSLANINAFQNTPFASDGTGGTLYVPQALIPEYQSASNWSTILGYANNQILPIEGSIYEEA